MSMFIENVNRYLSQMKIKQTFVSLKSGIDTKKLSRILTGVQDINSTDMERIAKALGQKTEYFLSDDFTVVPVAKFAETPVAFYVGEPSKEQEEYAMQLIELIANADQILSAKGRFMMTGE